MIAAIVAVCALLAVALVLAAWDLGRRQPPVDVVPIPRPRHRADDAHPDAVHAAAVLQALDGGTHPADWQPR